MAPTNPLTVLLLGAGGREHALAWKLSQSSRVQAIYVCPGNGGTSTVPKTTNISVNASDFPALVKFALENKVRRAAGYYLFPNSRVLG